MVSVKKTRKLGNSGKAIDKEQLCLGVLVEL